MWLGSLRLNDMPVCTQLAMLLEVSRGLKQPQPGLLPSLLWQESAKYKYNDSKQLRSDYIDSRQHRRKT